MHGKSEPRDHLDEVRGFTCTRPLELRLRHGRDTDQNVSNERRPARGSDDDFPQAFGISRAGRLGRRCRLGGCTGGESECAAQRSEEHTSELQSLMRISYAVFCLKKKTKTELHITLRNT